MTQEKQTLGQAIDQIVQALESLDEAVRKTALMAACLHLRISFPDTAPRPSSGKADASEAATHAPAPNPQTQRSNTDIRALKDEKKPKTASQMACVVAYYLQELAPENERKEAVSAADLEKYFKQAGFRLPQRVQQVLPDAKAAGYMDSVGRGEYKLNAVGYNLVAHNLPTKATGD